MKQNWRKIPCRKIDLQLDPTLGGGQSFRWKKTDDNWVGVFRNRVWCLSQTEDNLLYQCYRVAKQEMNGELLQSARSRKRKAEMNESEGEDENLLKDYFRLDVDLRKYYELWSRSDPNFKESASTFYGIRMLNQDLVENLFSFICSSNNNITRISSMVEKLCTLYGNEITKLDNVSYYSFPDIERLSSPEVESDLRKAGFGYRAKFIHQSAQKIESLGGEKWMKDLKLMSYQEAKRELMKLPGIGAKVADCICLMSLSHLEAIPVDTHIFQVASQIYLPHLKGCKSVTEKIYNEISSYFQELYGEKAGWAHTGKQVAHLNVLLVYVMKEMPQTDFIQCDRITVLKLVAIIEMTVSSILLLLYSYLCVLQDWTSKPDARNSVLEYRWLIIFMTVYDFGLGTLLAYAANLVKNYRRPKVLLWIVFDSVLPPVNTFILSNMNYEIKKSTPLSTDVHLRRTIYVHTVYTCMHFVFIMIVINFLAYYKPKLKRYDPSARPDSVFEPTDPKITTTESRHIRFSESFLKMNRKSAEVEASTSTKNEFQLHEAVSSTLGLYKLALIPFVTAYWLRQIPGLLKTLKLGKVDEEKMPKSSTQIRLTHPAICYLLAHLHDIKKLTSFKKQRR